jgi:hypothetical protein
MKHPIPILAAAVVLSATPALAVSYSNGYFDEPLVLKVHSNQVQVSEYKLRQTIVEPTVIAVPQVKQVRHPVAKSRCYSRTIELNADGGTVRICERSSASTIARRATTDLI